MRQKFKILSVDFTFMTWKDAIVIAIICLYLILFGSWVLNNSLYGNDYLAFWSVGKIANDKGYSEIYDLNNLRMVQAQALKDLGLYKGIGDTSFSPLPAAIFSFFVLPFQLLSKMNLKCSFWIWTVFNSGILIAYLVFFLKQIHPKNCAAFTSLNVLILMLISFPVLDNIANGQVEVFLLICTGEFIRNSICRKPFLSGLWLGGLLLKPQILILVIPIILIMHYWRVFEGFAVTSGTIIITSFILSGFEGTKALIKLWVGYAGGIATSAPEAMINWRMVGLDLNTVLKTSDGWLVTVFGTVLTIFIVYLLIYRRPPYGSPQWVMTMLGCFSATLAITWHSHYHMALVIVLFLAYALFYKTLPEKIVYFWAIVTPVAWFIMAIVPFLISLFARIYINSYQGLTIALSGFIANLAILVSVLKLARNREEKQINNL